MKKYLLCLILAMSVSASTFAGDIDDLLNKLSKQDQVETVKIGRFFMKMAMLAAPKGDEPNLRGIRSLEVMSLDNVAEETNVLYGNLFKTIQDSDGYETVVQVKDGGDFVRILMKQDKGVIKEILLLCQDQSDLAVVKIKGKLKVSDFTQLAETHGKSF